MEQDANTKTTPPPSVDTDTALTAAPTAPAKPDRGGFVWGTGRRKSSVARVRVRPAQEKGKGQFLVNQREIEN